MPSKASAIIVAGSSRILLKTSQKSTTKFKKFGEGNRVSVPLATLRPRRQAVRRTHRNGVSQGSTPAGASKFLWLLANRLCGLAGLIPIGAFARRTELRFSVALGGPFVSAAFTFPVPDGLFNPSHAAMLC